MKIRLLLSEIIPNSVTFIGNNAFEGCFDLTSIAIPNLLTYIGDDAFCGCIGLSSINIPNSVTYIGPSAFYNCNALTDVTANWSIPLSVSIYVFLGTNTSDITLYVPKGTEALYQADPVWGTFGTIIEGVTPALTMSITPTSLNFTASSEQQALTITSNTSWRVSSSDSWLTISPTSGSNNSAVTVTAAENTTTSQRTATITIYGIIGDINGDGILNGEDMTIITTISVTQDAANVLSVVPDETQTVGADGKGIIGLNLSIPSDVSLTGSFEITFPAGMTLDEQLTVLSAGLSNSSSLSFTYEENNTWLVEIKSNSLKSSTDTEYTKIMDIAYTVNDSIGMGTYEATIKNLDFLLDDGTSIIADSLSAPITVERWGTAIENIGNASFHACFIDNTLRIESSQAETITIYSAAGVQLYSIKKSAGTIDIPVSPLSGLVYIIKGSKSGTIKVVR